jgi:hypothetical protein
MLITDRMKLNIRHIINILCIPVIITGVYNCFQGIETIDIANKTHTWKTAPGTITYSGVETSRNNHRQSTTVYQKPKVDYVYIVNGVNYQGNTIYWGDDRSPALVSYTDSIVSKYPKHKKIVVYYHPSSPQQSVLETGTSEVTFVPLVFGGILIFVGSLLPVIFFIFRNSPTGSIKFEPRD